MNDISQSSYGLETKFSPLAREDVEGAVLSGYASVFGIPDQNGDIVEAGAFDASLRRLRDSGRGVKMLWQHDPAEPIGVWSDVAEDALGLRVRGRLLNDVARGAEATALIHAGAIDGLSIGYRTVRAEKAGRGRRLIELDLWEVSLVTFPMLPDARVRALSPDPDPEADIAQALATALIEARTLFS